MDRFENPEPVHRRFEFEPVEPPVTRSHGVSREKKKPRSRTPQSYRVCDGVTEGLIYFMVVFTPWAFGTTQTWAIWTMNVTAYVLGVALVTKWAIRWKTGYAPARWGSFESPGSNEARADRREKWSQVLTLTLAVLTCVILTYILISAINKRAVYLEGLRRFEYFDAIKWLPHSYDAPSTWQCFWMYSGLACFFWSLRDWLLGKTAHERKRKHGESREEEGEIDEGMGEVKHKLHTHREAQFQIPDRLKRLLWVLCINGAIVGLEGILQRLSGTNKLLWFMETRFHRSADAQFGPYAYRANGAQYMNLIWPVCLGFWALLRKAALKKKRLGMRIGESSHVVLLPAAVIMGVCPVVTTSRGGAIVAAGMILVSLVILLRTLREERPAIRIGVFTLFLIIVGFSGYLGWSKLAARFRTIFEDQMSRRTEIYENAMPMTRQFPVYGTGAGSFGALYQLYRASPEQLWDAYVHDDWLETRITLGWVGFGIVLVMLMIMPLKVWAGSSRIHLPLDFLSLVWLAMGGCLLHAKFDFPFQIYSIIWVFLLLCAIVFCTAPIRRSLHA